MSLRDKIEASPFFWIAGAAVGGFITCVSILGVIAPLAGLKLVWEGTYLMNRSIEQEYLPRRTVQDRFVSRSDYAECQRALDQQSQKMLRCREELSVSQPNKGRGLLKDSAIEHSPEAERSEAATSSESTATTLSTADPKQSGVGAFQSRWFEVKVLSIDIGIDHVAVVVDIRPRGDENVKFQLNNYQTFLLDQAGHRWDRAKDTAGLFAHPAEQLLPGTSLRSRIRFRGDSSLGIFVEAGSAPDPELPFTFIATETHSGQRIVIEGLEPK